MSIQLVQGDDGPDLNLTLKDSMSGDPGDPDSWSVIDVSPSTTSVTMKFRLRNSTTVLETLTLTKVNGGTNGEVLLTWGATSLDVSPGDYEGEIEINENGKIQTLVDPIRFALRAQF